MVDYDEAERAVQDPNADPAFLARIAYENPTFDALVANHRRAYPGLLAWIAQFGTPEARRVLRMRTDLPEAVTRYLQEPDITPDTPDNGSVSDQATHQPVAQAQPAPSAQLEQSSSDDLDSSPFVHTSLQSDLQPAQSTQSTETNDARETSEEAQQQASQQAEDQHPAISQQSADQQTVGNNQESESTSAGQQQSEQSPAQSATPATAASVQPAQPAQAAGPALKLSPLAQQLLTETGLEADSQVHGHTPAEAMDAQTSWMAQHDIAVQAPELLPFLALNSNIYPELKSWLANLGDPLINQALSGTAA